MCQETDRNHPILKQLVQTWYMRHVFKDLRGSWRCISFARTKTKKSYQSQAEMARSLNLQRASARARAAASRSNHLPGDSSDKSRWMYRTFGALYSHSQRTSRTKETFSKLKNLLRSNSFDNRDPVSSSSLAELIPCVDFDLDNVVISTDSDLQTTGEPPSRRSTDSFLSTRNGDTSTGVGSVTPRSPFRAMRHYRRKRSVVRAAKVALTGHGNAGGKRQTPAAANGIGRSTYGNGMTTTMTEKGLTTTPVLATPENLSRGTSLTMDTSSSPCKSSSTSWLENYDALTESLSISSSWSTSLQTDSLPEMKRSEEWKRAIPVDDKQDWFHDDDHKQPSSPVNPPISSEELQQRQASAIKGALHTGKDFQQAIVDIILENDVNDLLDLEEFLQGYFRLNSLYQDIIQQFFSDLSNDLVHPQASRAPSVIARIASSNRKCAKNTDL